MTSEGTGSEANAWLVLISTVDVLCIAVTHLILVVFVLIMCRRKSFNVFHPNLTLILLSQAASYAVFLAPRGFSALVNIFTGRHLITDPNFRAINIVYNAGLSSIGLNLAAFSIERLFATVLFSIYEKWCATVPYLAIFVLVIQWTYSIVSSTLSLEGFIPNIHLLVTTVSVYILATVVFSVLPLLSRFLYNRYKRKHQSSTSYSLTERFQLSDNVKSAKVLNTIILFICASSLAGYTLYWLINYRYYTTETRWPLERCFDILVCIQAVGMCVLGLRSRECLHAQMAAMVCRSRKVRDGVPTTLNGNVLVLPLEHERQAYFEALRTAWDA